MGACVSSTLEDQKYYNFVDIRNEPTFEVLKQLGKGGFGEVYLARRLKKKGNDAPIKKSMENLSAAAIVPAPSNPPPTHNAKLSHILMGYDAPDLVAVKRIDKRRVLHRGNKNARGQFLSAKAQARAKQQARNMKKSASAANTNRMAMAKHQQKLNQSQRTANATGTVNGTSNTHAAFAGDKLSPKDTNDQRLGNPRKSKPSKIKGKRMKSPRKLSKKKKKEKDKEKGEKDDNDNDNDNEKENGNDDGNINGVKSPTKAKKKKRKRSSKARLPPLTGVKNGDDKNGRMCNGDGNLKESKHTNNGGTNEHGNGNGTGNNNVGVDETKDGDGNGDENVDIDNQDHHANNANNANNGDNGNNGGSDDHNETKKGNEDEKNSHDSKKSTGKASPDNGIQGNGPHKNNDNHDEHNANHGASADIKHSDKTKIDPNNHNNTGEQRATHPPPAQAQAQAQVQAQAENQEDFNRKWRDLSEKRRRQEPPWRLSSTVWIERDIMSRVVLLMRDCPFLLGLLHAAQDDNFLYLIMPYMVGGDLQDILNAVGSLNMRITRFYACQILLGLEALHSQKILFRDLKPRNVLVRSDGYLCLSDYGLCKELREQENYTTKARVGTRGYIAPEVMNGAWYDYSCDVFSFGVTIYRMMTGRSAFGKNGTNYTKRMRFDKYDKVRFIRLLLLGSVCMRIWHTCNTHAYA